MESGIVKLFPAFAGSADTTAEEMKTYVKTGVDLFCSLSGLVILENKTIDHTYGVVYLLGTEGTEQAIIAIGNYNHETYFYSHIFYSLIGPDDKVEYTHYTSSTTSEGYAGKALGIRNYNCYMKYIKGNKNFIFDIGAGLLVPSSVKCNIITKFQQNNIEKDIMLNIYSSRVYMSYATINGNEGDRALFNLETNKVAYIKDSEEGILNIYTSGNGEFPYIKLYSNRMQLKVWTMFSAGNKKYIILNSNNGYFTPIAEID